MADPKHPRHYDEAFKRQIVQLYESGKPSRKIRRRGPTSSGPSSYILHLTPLEASDNMHQGHHPYGFHHDEQPHRTTRALIALRR